MYGAIFGDYVGSIYEFDNIKTKEFDLYNPKASITDDTYMTIAVASACLSYADHRDRDQFTKDVGRELRRIGRLYPFPMGGYGSMFCEWLMSRDPQPYGSQGNGSAMRVSPCSWVANSLREAEALGWASALPTHNGGGALLGAKATAGAIYLARTIPSRGTEEGRQCIKRYLQEYFYPMDQSLDEIRPAYEFNGLCENTVPQAMQAFIESSSFEDAIRNAISIGGDSDTIAAITGAVAEAFYSMPEELVAITKRALSDGLREDEMEIVDDFRAEFCTLERKEFHGSC